MEVEMVEKPMSSQQRRDTIFMSEEVGEVR